MPGGGKTVRRRKDRPAAKKHKNRKNQRDQND